MKVSAARRAAFEILLRVEAEDAYAGNLLSSARYSGLSREDHALAQELTLGVLRWRARLDFLIEHYARRKISRLDQAVVIALRLGLYQLHHLTRVPPHAAVNESVNLIREQKLKSAAPLVNAVLRAAQREGHATTGDLSSSIKDPLVRLSIETSHPAWLLERWVKRFGEDEARALATANNSPARAAFRFNPRRTPEESTRAWLAEHSVGIRDSAIAPHAAVIESGSLTANAEPVQQGWIYFQDEASQLVAHLAAESGHPARTPRALDLCAAPGSKTTLMALLLPEDTFIVAGDLHLHRLRTMKELMARSGVSGINLIQLDAAKELPFADGQGFDLVLLDAPCSGLGTLERHPEIKWRMNEEKIRELAALQKQLLANAARHVRAGGLLTYSVCSTEFDEGEEVIAWFRDSHSEYRDITRERLTELGLDPVGLLTPTFGARTFTHRHGTESFFACVMWKRR
ncbi:MAG TPA: 16S rRNA (cytosine(967)-C(5))-methyltransferase RsmB [Blastocatellia bacterium]|nr:16S rRNA (cytosine(967)-C(5))-methyltransferase RsmB [Blastocatellia bacterium]